MVPEVVLTLVLTHAAQNSFTRYTRTTAPAGNARILRYPSLESGLAEITSLINTSRVSSVVCGLGHVLPLSISIEYDGNDHKHRTRQFPDFSTRSSLAMIISPILEKQRFLFNFNCFFDFICF